MKRNKIGKSTLEERRWQRDVKAIKYWIELSELNKVKNEK